MGGKSSQPLQDRISCRPCTCVAVGEVPFLAGSSLSSSPDEIRSCQSIMDVHQCGHMCVCVCVCVCIYIYIYIYIYIQGVLVN